MPVVLLLVVSTLMIIVITLIAALRIDRQAETDSRRVVVASFAELQAGIGQEAYDYAWWDSLAANIVQDLDREWAAGNIGYYMRDAYGYHASWVIAADDRPIIGFLDGEETDRDPAEVFSDGLARLIDEAREAPMEEPRPVTGFIALDGQVAVIGAAAVTPEYPSEEQLRRVPRPVLLFAKRIGEDFLARLADMHRLREAEILARRPADEWLAFAFRDPLGGELAWYVWQPAQPGRQLLLQVAPAIGGAILAMTLLAFVVLRRAEQNRQAQRRLHSSLQRERELHHLKTRFVNMVSHELRTPLTTIRAAADLLADYGDRLSGQERAAELTAIREEVGSMTRLVEDVLAVGRSAEELGGEQVDDIDLGQEITRLWSTARRGTGRDNEMRLTLPEHCPPLRASPLLFDMALRNILSNALKFSGAGEDIEVAVRADHGDCEIVIRDRGIGIPSGEIDAVFEPFHRARNAEARSGTGLGLAIVQQAVSQLGGTVTLDSTENVGTTVVVRLPWQRGRVAQTGRTSA